MALARTGIAGLITFICVQDRMDRNIAIGRRVMGTLPACLGTGGTARKACRACRQGRCRRVWPDMVIATQSQCMGRVEETSRRNVVIAARAGDPKRKTIGSSRLSDVVITANRGTSEQLPFARVTTTEL